MSGGAAGTTGASAGTGMTTDTMGTGATTGATPPMAKPVSDRTRAASALPSGSPASSAAFAGSTRLPPAVRNRRQ